MMAATLSSMGGHPPLYIKIQMIYESLEPDDVSPWRVPLKHKAYTTSKEEIRAEKQEILDRDPGYDAWIEWVANTPNMKAGDQPPWAKEEGYEELKAEGERQALEKNVDPNRTTTS